MAKTLCCTINYQMILLLASSTVHSLRESSRPTVANRNLSALKSLLANCNQLTPMSWANALRNKRLENTSDSITSPLLPPEANSQPTEANVQQLTLKLEWRIIVYICAWEGIFWAKCWVKKLTGFWSCDQNFCGGKMLYIYTPNWGFSG